VYFVGRKGLVAHLGGDGQLVVQPTPKDFDLYAAWASGPRDVYAVGDYGIILHSAGDGQWAVQESGTREPLFAVAGTGPSNVFAAGRTGTLLRFGAGAPPDMTPPGSCSGPGECGSSCTAGMLTQRGCDRGQCTDLPPAACAGGYLCANATSCATSCAGDSECQPDFFCDSTGACQARKAQGVSCNADAGGECKGAGCRVCGDGFYCTDHVCCDKPASQCGGCMHCVAPSGTCQNVTSGQDPHNYCPATTDECQATTCNGSGSCAKPNATACGVDMCSGNQLTKHTCQSGACTASAPTTCANGTTCSTDGKTCLGKCAADSDCAQGGAGSYCDANGDCQPRKAQGGTCNVAAGGDCKVAGCGECQSGLSCADGYCCNSGCGGQCEACNVAGKLGACSPVPAGTQPHHGALCAGAGTPTCGGYCDGSNRTSCYVPPATTKYKKATCSARDMLDTATYCDGKGGIGTNTTVSCGYWACEKSGSSTIDDRCYQKCATVTECANDNLACVNTHCGLPNGSTCKATDPLMCASTYCPTQVSGAAYCCNEACGPTCNWSRDPTLLYASDCTTGTCRLLDFVVKQCGPYLCDPNVNACKTTCTCLTVANVDGCDSKDCGPGHRCYAPSGTKVGDSGPWCK
jgi:hypothetical protein